ncbi:hypothetical protein T439DRAFT_380899, partial [Meredithblackwellia eburnea MCA 4105]
MNALFKGVVAGGANAHAVAQGFAQGFTQEMNKSFRESREDFTEALRLQALNFMKSTFDRGHKLLNVCQAIQVSRQMVFQLANSVYDNPTGNYLRVLQGELIIETEFEKDGKTQKPVHPRTSPQFRDLKSRMDKYHFQIMDRVFLDEDRFEEIQLLLDLLMPGRRLVRLFYFQMSSYLKSLNNYLTERDSSGTLNL